MKICIEANQLIGKWSGVKRYTLNLIKALAEVDQKNHYLLLYHFFSPQYFEKLLALPNRRFEQKILRLPDRITNSLWHFFHFPPIEKIVGKIDVFHAPYYLLPPTKAPTVMTVLDVLPTKYPRYYSASQWYHFANKILPPALKRATRIIAISQQVKSDLLDLFDLPSEKIKVVYLGVEDRFFVSRQKELNNYLKKYNLKTNQYFLYVAGTLNPRKNIPALLRVYESLSKNIRKKYPLVIVSGAGDVDFKIPAGVKMLFAVKDGDLPLIYQGAKFFIYPSFAEGFGLPVLEAMASGLPIITSNCSVMPEIVGETAILINPQKPQTIRSAMLKLLKNENLSKKLALAAKKRAKQFSWQRCARETLKVYEEAIEEIEMTKPKFRL